MPTTEHLRIHINNCNHNCVSKYCVGVVYTINCIHKLFYRYVNASLCRTSLCASINFNNSLTTTTNLACAYLYRNNLPCDFIVFWSPFNNLIFHQNVRKLFPTVLMKKPMSESLSRIHKVLTNSTFHKLFKICVYNEFSSLAFHRVERALFSLYGAVWQTVWKLEWSGETFIVVIYIRRFLAINLCLFNCHRTKMEIL